MSPEALGFAPERPAQRGPDRPLRIVDVTVFYGERTGGIRTYLQAKAAYAAATGAFEHYLVVPGRQARSDEHRRELPSIRMNGANGYRVPLGGSELQATLAALRPDVVLLHDPFWTPRAATAAAHEAGALVVAVHHSSAAQHASAIGRPGRAAEGALRRWYRRAYQDVDAVMSAVDPHGDCGRAATIPLRLGLDPAFRVQPDAQRGGHVLYVGRFAKEKGLRYLLQAAAGAGPRWQLVLRGAGPAEGGLRDRAQELGINGRVTFAPFLSDRKALARAYAEAACVVAPGSHETFGLVALEAAASGARVVAAACTPAVHLLGELAETFRPGDPADMRRAIDRARGRGPDLEQAAALSERHSWEAALTAELDDLRSLVCQ